MDKVQVPDVTIIAVDCTDRITNTIKSLIEGCKIINFGEVKLVSHKKPDILLPDFVKFEECKKINNINEFNNFMFFELGDYFSTSHCLYVQDHARILNPELWNNDWLNYDYVGAPWPYTHDSYICHNTKEHVRVGNGGFSIRSHKLQSLPKVFNLELKQEQGWYNEDGNFCVYHRKFMLEHGIKYAPLNVAKYFSYETSLLENADIKTFGYHRNRP